MTELIVIRAEDDAKLIAKLARIVEFLDRVPDVNFTDVAYTCSLDKGKSVLAVIADDVSELRARLFSARSRLETQAPARIRDKSGTYYFRNHLLGENSGKLAFLYSGVPGFYPDMLRDLAVADPICRNAFDELEEALKDNEEFTPSSFIFPPASYYRHDADIFKSGAYAQAMVSTFAACTAFTRLVASWGLNPDGVVGFAGGDFAAMLKSGAAGEKLSRPDRVKAIREIYNIVDKAVNHGGFEKVAMISTVLRRPGEIDELIKTLPEDKVRLTLDLSPRQKTFAVHLDYVDTFLKLFADAGVRTMKLPLDVPFNTPLCAAMVPQIRKFATSWMKQAPICEVYSCISAARISDSLKTARADIAERWAHPLKFADTIRRMHADGYRVFLEVGPRGLLTAAVDDTLKNEDHAAIALNSIHRRSILQIQHALGQLVALGAEVDISNLFSRRSAHKLDFDSAISLEVRRDTEMKLSRAFPKLSLLGGSSLLEAPMIPTLSRRRGAKAAQRAAAVAQQRRKQRQFDFGALHPLVSDADILEASPGVSMEVSKLFKLSELPFLGDFALGTSQMSYSDPNLKGLILLSIPVAAEIMAELAETLMPNRSLLRIEDFTCRRMISFERGELKLFVRAERAPSNDPDTVSVKLQLRDDSPNSAYTWPVMEATYVLGDVARRDPPLQVEALPKPRSVHWSSRDIYPARLCYGKRLRGITFVDIWSESGIDYEVEVPSLADQVAYTRFPMWVINPLLLQTVVSGFELWRSHERFVGAFSFPFHMRRLAFSGTVPAEGSKLKCYMRLTGVTPKSHQVDIAVSDGNGMELLHISGWEELTERVPNEYRSLIMQPAMSFLTSPLNAELLGNPSTDTASALVTDVPYSIFERNEELWLRMLSRVVLSASERKAFLEMTGSTSRRTEWLFGRIAAKECVRRYLKDYYQARWSNADIEIWADDLGKPHALGAWHQYLTTKIDIAIAHTAQFVVALAAANARIGVDAESVLRDLSDEFTNGVFTPEEQELAAQAVNPSQAIIKFWCAKEAVSKALGTGIRYSPKEMIVHDYQADSGRLIMRLEGAWLDAFKVFKGRDIVVTVKTVHDHALASCFIPLALFGDEE